MRIATRQFLLTSVVMVFAAGALAQTNVSTSAPQPTRDGQVVVPDQPTASDVNPTVVAKPTRPERSSLPTEVQDRLKRFQVDAHAYLDQQQKLKKQLQGANDKERALIRERLKELRRQWLEHDLEMRKEYRERMRELQDKLPEYRELLDSIRSSAQDKLRDAQDNSRTRRGED